MKAYNTYICYSLSHVYFALVRIISEDQKRVCLMYPDDLALSLDVLEGQLIDHFSTYPNKRIEGAWDVFKKQNGFKLHKYKRGLKNVVGSYSEINAWREIFTSSHFFIFNDGAPMVMYLLANYSRQPFTLLEEGELIYSERKRSINNLIKRIVGLPLPFGLSQSIKKIEVRFPERLPVKLQRKSSYYNIREKLTLLSEYHKQLLLKLFKVEALSISVKSLLLVPQPLSEDGLISEEEKLDLYREITNKYLQQGYHIYIKPHPRETTEYDKFFKNCSLIPKSFPVEMMNFLSVKFSVAITLFSTGIHLVPAQEHIILGLEYDHRVAKAWKAMVGVEKKN